MTFRELCKKQVIQSMEGICMGRVDDLIFDPATHRITGFLLYGRPRWFGLLGREPDLCIPVAEVKLFGADTLLVTTEIPPQTQPGRKGLFHSGGDL